LLHWLKSGVEEQQRRVETSNEKKSWNNEWKFKNACKSCCDFVQTDVIFNENNS
jgi:hypothetical protein